MDEMAKMIFNYGGTVIMAVLFVYIVIEDRKKSDAQTSANTKLLQELTQSNNNIAKSLDIISKSMETIDNKVDRNYEEIIRREK